MKRIRLKRKLLVTGDYTYMLTLPKEWVKKIGWRAKQMVYVELGRRCITVRPIVRRKTARPLSRRKKSLSNQKS